MCRKSLPINYQLNKRSDSLITILLCTKAMLKQIKLWLPPSSQDSKEGGELTRVTCLEAEDRLDPIRGLSCPPRKWLVIEPFVAAFLALVAILRYLQHPIITHPLWC